MYLWRFLKCIRWWCWVDIAISAIGSGSVSEIVIDNAGTGYSVGDKLVFDNTGTEGVNAEGFVSVVNGGIGEDGTGVEHILMEDETGKINTL